MPAVGLFWEGDASTNWKKRELQGGMGWRLMLGTVNGRAGCPERLRGIAGGLGLGPVCTRPVNLNTVEPTLLWFNSSSHCS